MSLLERFHPVPQDRVRLCPGHTELLYEIGASTKHVRQARLPELIQVVQVLVGHDCGSLDCHGTLPYVSQPMRALGAARLGMPGNPRGVTMRTAARGLSKGVENPLGEKSRVFRRNLLEVNSNPTCCAAYPSQQG